MPSTVIPFHVDPVLVGTTVPLKYQAYDPPAGLTEVFRFSVCPGVNDGGMEGIMLTVGIGLIYKVAAPEVTAEQSPVSITLNDLVLSAKLTLGTVNELEVEPAIFTQAVPFHSCHW